MLKTSALDMGGDPKKSLPNSRRLHTRFSNLKCLLSRQEDEKIRSHHKNKLRARLMYKILKNIYQKRKELIMFAKNTFFFFFYNSIITTSGGGGIRTLKETKQWPLNYTTLGIFAKNFDKCRRHNS